MHVIQKLAASLSLASVCVAATAAGNLVIDPLASSVNPGNAFSLKVLGTAFSDVVVGGGFNLSFNSSLLRLDSVQINVMLWEFAPSSGTINNVAGTLSDAYFNTFNNSPTGNFEAATLNFTAKAPGNAAVTLSSSASFPFASSAAEVITVTFGSGQVAVVPEPATVVTMLLGLGLLALARARHF